MRKVVTNVYKNCIDYVHLNKMRRLCIWYEKVAFFIVKTIMYIYIYIVALYNYLHNTKSRLIRFSFSREQGNFRRLNRWVNYTKVCTSDFKLVHPRAKWPSNAPIIQIFLLDQPRLRSFPLMKQMSTIKFTFPTNCSLKPGTRHVTCDELQERKKEVSCCHIRCTLPHSDDNFAEVVGSRI